MAFDIETSVYDDMVIVDRQKIPRFYVPVYDDSVMYVLGKKPVHPEYEFYNRNGNVKDYIQRTDVGFGNMSEHYDTIGDLVVIVVECRIPVGTTLIHDSEDTQTIFAGGVYSFMQYERHIPDLEEWVKHLLAMDEIWIHECDCGNAIATEIKKPNLCIDGIKAEFTTQTVVIPTDKRTIAYSKLEKGEYNNYVRKPLDSGSAEYKNGKRAIPILFRYYLYSLIKDCMKECPLAIRNEIPNGNKHMGRSGIPPEDYLFYLIDQVHENTADFEYEGMMSDIVEKKYTTSKWRANAVGGYAGRQAILPFFEFMIMQSGGAFRGYENLFAVDGSGFTCTAKGDYCHEKHGKEKHNIWITAHTMIGVNSNVVIGLKVTKSSGEESHEINHLDALIKQAQRNYSIKYVLGDGGYLSEEKLNHCKEEYGIRLVFPIKSNTVVTAPYKTDLWNDNNELNLSSIWSDVYHPRSNVEATFSAMKHTIGETVKAKNEIARFSEVYCKFIAYNIRVLIMYYFVAHIVPEWVDVKKIEELLKDKL